MYLYFNETGVLKEIINDAAIRQGDSGNKIYFFIEGADPQVDPDTGVYNALSFYAGRRTFFDVEGNELEDESFSISTIEKTIPYDKKRELKHFKYFTKYEMFSITIPDELLNDSGTVGLRIQMIQLDEVSPFTLGFVVFNIEKTGTGLVISPDTAITIAQWNYLINNMLDKQGFEDLVKKVIITISNPSSDTSDYDNGQLFYAKSNKKVYIKENGSLVVYQEFVSPTDLATKQDTLVSGQNIKTINNQSILGSGNIDIEGLGDAEWGSITGNIEDQTDLQNELSAKENISNKVTQLSNLSTDTQYPSAKIVFDNLNNIREVAEGKCNTFILSYNDTLSNVKQALIDDSSLKIFDGSGNNITEAFKNGDYDDRLLIDNAIFNSNADAVGDLTSESEYSLICRFFSGLTVFDYNFVIVDVNISEVEDSDVKIGDIVWVIETDVPDRWFGFSNSWNFYKLETSKVDLSNYYTKTESDEKFVDLTSDQDISGRKNFKNSQGITVDNNSGQTTYIRFAQRNTVGEVLGTLYRPLFNNQDGKGFIIGNESISPNADGTLNLGCSVAKWKDLYLSGAIKNNNATYGLTLPDMTSWTANSEIVDTESDQTINGIKIFNATTTRFREIAPTVITTYTGANKIGIGTNITIYANLIPSANNSVDLGSSSYKWNNLYLSGNLSDGTNSVTVAQMAAAAGVVYKHDMSIEDNGGNVYSLAYYSSKSTPNTLADLITEKAKILNLIAYDATDINMVIDITQSGSDIVIEFLHGQTYFNAPIDSISDTVTVL